MRLSETGGIVDEAGRLVPVAEIMAEVTAMKVEQTRLAEKLQNYIAMWKDAQAQVQRLHDAYVRAYHESYAFMHPGASETVRRADADDFMRRVRALRGEGQK